MCWITKVNKKLKPDIQPRSQFIKVCMRFYKIFDCRSKSAIIVLLSNMNLFYWHDLLCSKSPNSTNEQNTCKTCSIYRRRRFLKERPIFLAGNNSLIFSKQSLYTHIVGIIANFGLIQHSIGRVYKVTNSKKWDKISLGIYMDEYE